MQNGFWAYLLMKFESNMRGEIITPYFLYFTISAGLKIKMKSTPFVTAERGVIALGAHCPCDCEPLSLSQTRVWPSPLSPPCPVRRAEPKTKPAPWEARAGVWPLEALRLSSRPIAAEQTAPPSAASLWIIPTCPRHLGRWCYHMSLPHHFCPDNIHRLQCKVTKIVFSSPLKVSPILSHFNLSRKKTSLVKHHYKWAVVLRAKGKDLKVNTSESLCFSCCSCSSSLYTQYQLFLILAWASKIPQPELSITCLATSVRVKINFLPEQQTNSSAETKTWQEQIAESREEKQREGKRR